MNSERRRVPKAYRHIFTPQADEIIRAEYRLSLHGRRPYAIKDRLGSKLGVPGWVTQRRATELGITRIKEPRWTDVEVELLAIHAWKNPDLIRRIFLKRGYTRSSNSIWLKIKRRLGGRRMNRPFYTANELSELLGVDRHAVGRWIAEGRLSSKRGGTNRVEKQGGDMYFIRPRDVRAFVAANPKDIDLRKVDQHWFIDLLTNSKAEAAA